MNNLNPPSNPARNGTVALLIDGENMPASLVGKLIVHAGRHGELVVKRVYGNVTALSGWQKTSGLRMVNTGSEKNSADMLLAIEAVEFAHISNVSCFAIATSDGDFSHLAHFLREKGFTVVGIGEPKAPDGFRKACSEFHEIENRASGTKITSEENNINQKVKRFIRENSNGRGVPISLLGGKMHSQHNIKISGRPEKTWRAYLTNRPEMFEVEPRSKTAHVRLK